MKKLLLLSALLIFACGFCQGEQLSTDGVATDQDGNEFEWINYGTQDWSTVNADVTTYKDGTTIPQVTDINNWDLDLFTGAWTYLDNDPTKPRLYNWYAVMGIHDTDPNTPNKEFAPEGWHVPSDGEWTTLEEWLIANGYNYDGTTTENKILKAIASSTGWEVSANIGAVGNDQSLNNSSGFSAFPSGYSSNNGSGYYDFTTSTKFWSAGTGGNGRDDRAWIRDIRNYESDDTSWRYGMPFGMGFSVRFARGAQTASTNNNTIFNFKFFPNPTKNYLYINNLNISNISIYGILGKELIKVSSKNRIDVSSLSKGVYFIKVSDGINTSTKKFIKN